MLYGLVQVINNKRYTFTELHPQAKIYACGDKII